MSGKLIKIWMYAIIHGQLQKNLEHSKNITT